MKYSVDTSAILDCWNRHYPPDIFPVVWEKIDELIEQKLLIATELVLDELGRKDDEVFEWASNRQSMFINLDYDIQIVVKEILSDHKKLIDERKGRSGADPFVIALAKVEGCAVLTGEKPTGKSNRPNIPDACDSLGIPWLNLVQPFRDRNWVFR